MNSFITSDIHDQNEIANVLTIIHNENFNKKVEKKYFLEIFDCENYKCFLLKKIIENSEVIIGYIVYYYNFDNVDLFEIAIDKKYHGKGNGQNLFEKSVCKLFQSEPFKNLEEKNILLEVNEKNEKAIKFYEKNGFQKISVRKNYYGSNENGIIMIKKVRN